MSTTADNIFGIVSIVFWSTALGSAITYAIIKKEISIRWLPPIFQNKHNANNPNNINTNHKGNQVGEKTDDATHNTDSDNN
jgi:hypothetical protein